MKCTENIEQHAKVYRSEIHYAPLLISGGDQVESLQKCYWTLVGGHREAWGGGLGGHEATAIAIMKQIILKTRRELTMRKEKSR